MKKNHARSLLLSITLFFSLVYISIPHTHVAAQKESRDLRVARSSLIGKWPASTKRWALIIGVDQYQDRQISALSGAANDAKALAEALVRFAGFPSDQVILLATDQPQERQPTRVNILRRLSNLTSVIPPDGLLLVSFAGHGIERGGQAFLLPSDAQISQDVTFLEDTAVPVTKVRDRIQATGVQQVVLMLDACRNDPVGRADSPNNLTENYVRGFSFDERNKGVTAFAILYATRVGYRAYEYTEKRQGYFTWAVVEGLKGAAANEKGEITLASLVSYIQTTVPKRIGIDLGTGKDQQPWTDIQGYKAEELVLAMVPQIQKPAVPESVQSSGVDPALAELNFWRRIKGSTASSDFEAYLKQYPNGEFVEQANKRLQQLRASAAPVGATTSKPALTLEGTQPSVSPSKPITENKGGAETADSSNQQLARNLNEQADALFSQGKYAEAEPLYRRVLDIQEKSFGKGHISAAKAREKLIELYYSSGDIKVKKGDFEGAVKDFSQGLDIDPQNASLYGHRGTAKVKKGDYNGALLDLTRAVGLNPRFLAAYNNLGYIKNYTGDYDGAIADYSKVIELQPKLTVGYIGRGTAFSKKGLPKQAQEDFDKARAIDPSVQIPSIAPTAAPTPSLYFDSANMNAGKGSYSEAIADYNRAIQGQSNGLFYKLRGFAKENLRDYQGALLDYANGIKNDSNDKSGYEVAHATFTRLWEGDQKNVLALMYRGFLSFACGKYEEAISDFTQVTEVAPKSQAAYSSYIYRAIAKYNKDFEGSVKDLDQAKKIYPNNAWTRVIAFNIRGDYWQEGASRDLKADQEIQEVYQLNSKLYSFIVTLTNDSAIVEALDKFYNVARTKKSTKNRWKRGPALWSAVGLATTQPSL